MKISLKKVAISLALTAMMAGVQCQHLSAQETAVQEAPAQETDEQAADVEQEVQTTEGDELPEAAEVISRFVEATGGLEKYKSIRSLKQIGTMSMEAQGITGAIDVMLVHPDKAKSEVKIEGIGNEISCSNGVYSWAMSTMMGNRLLEEAEVEELRFQSNMTRMYDPGSVYEEVTCTGIEEVDGKKCYVIELVRPSGLKSLDYYEVDSGLQVKSVAESRTAMGDMTTTSMISDYQDVDGILMPFKSTVELDNGIAIAIEFETVELNPEIPETAFQVPEQIEKLIQKQKDAEAKKEAEAAAEDKGGEREESEAVEEGDGG